MKGTQEEASSPKGKGGDADWSMNTAVDEAREIAEKWNQGGWVICFPDCIKCFTYVYASIVIII